MLRKYVKDPNHIIESEPDVLAEDLTYEEVPVKILEKKGADSTLKGYTSSQSFMEKSRYRGNDLGARIRDAI